jgi:transglutaminase/protease-like cytokinesis protein 3
MLPGRRNSTSVPAPTSLQTASFPPAVTCYADRCARGISLLSTRTRPARSQEPRRITPSSIDQCTRHMAAHSSNSARRSRPQRRKRQRSLQVAADVDPEARGFRFEWRDPLLDLRHDRSRDRIADMRYVRPFWDAERPVQESDVTSAAQVVQQAGSEDNARRIGSHV